VCIPVRITLFQSFYLLNWFILNRYASRNKVSYSPYDIMITCSIFIYQINIIFTPSLSNILWLFWNSLSVTEFRPFSPSYLYSSFSFHLLHFTPLLYNHFNFNPVLLFLLQFLFFFVLFFSYFFTKNKVSANNTCSETQHRSIYFQVSLQHSSCRGSIIVLFWGVVNLWFEFLTAVEMLMLVLWVATPCGFVGWYQRFRGTYCLHSLQSGR
jgi:hypothetical protein